MAEAWVSTFKAELVGGRVFTSFEQAEHEALRWIGFYNHERLHEALGDIPPVEYEQNFHLAAADDALGGDLSALTLTGKVTTSTDRGRYAPVEADQPAFTGALAGLGPSTETR